MKIYHFLIPAVFCAMLASCSNDDEVVLPEEETPVVNITELAQTIVKPDVFKTQILGFGWRNVAEYKYDLQAKKFADHDWFGREEDSETGPLLGINPVHYFFGEDAIVVYSVTFYPSDPKIDGAWATKCPCTYDTKNDQLVIPGTDSSSIFVFEEVNDSKMSLILKSRTGDYHRIVFERMTDAELEEMNTVYRPR